MSQATTGEPATFGEMLRFLRHRMQMTQQQLGAALGYSAAMVARLESDERLPDLALVKTAYVEALDLEREPELAAQFVALAERARGDGHAAPPSTEEFRAALRTNLPRQLTPFIGRAGEVAEVTRLLASHQLVTLTGAGGVGKTRLALEVAASLVGASQVGAPQVGATLAVAPDDPRAAARAAPTFPDGVRLVELAPLNDPTLVPLAAARAFRLPEGTDQEPAEALAAFLARRRVLIVLDNCEHLIDACAALVDGLLRACPGVCVLATSREPLRVPGEAAWRVPSMDAGEAARLFEERAQLVQPGFALTERNVGAVDEICRRLDGIPLAIELAAAQARVLPVEQIAARLGDRFHLLTGGARTALPRQQTLRATLDWSYALLSEPERVLFARLSVFAGGWTLEAAEVVCGDQPLAMEALSRKTSPTIPSEEVLGLLTSLADKSLVVVENREGAVRYRLLETLRQYAQERLAEAGQVDALRDRHLAYYMSFMERAHAEFMVSKQQPWKARIQAEYDNLRAAQDWCRANAAESAHAEACLRISVALAVSWIDNGYTHDIMQWLQWLWDSAVWQYVTRQATSPSTMLQAKALFFLGAYPIHDNNTGPLNGELAAPAEECLARCRAVGDREGIGYSLLSLAMLAEHGQDYARAQALVLEGLGVFEELRYPLGLGYLFTHLIDIYRALNANEELITILERQLQLSREWKIGWYSGEILAGLANQMLWLGERARAAVLSEQLLDIWDAWDDPIRSSVALQYLQLADPPRAQVLAERYLAQRRQAGDEESVAIALHRLGSILIDHSEYSRALAILDECVARFRSRGDVPSCFGLARALNVRAVAARFMGDYRQALAGFDECDRVRGEWSSSQAWLGVAVPFNRGITLLEMGDVEAAAAAFKASLKKFKELQAPREFPPLLFAALADVLWARGELRPAMKLAGAAAAFVREEYYNNPNEVLHYERTIAAARARLDDPALAAAWAEGQAMTWDQAIEYGLAV